MGISHVRKHLVILDLLIVLRLIGVIVSSLLVRLCRSLRSAGIDVSTTHLLEKTVTAPV